MPKQIKRPFVSHKGVDIFDCFKGNRNCRPWFATCANAQVDGSFFVFDARRLPRRYRKGLIIQYDLVAKDRLLGSLSLGTLEYLEKMKELWERESADSKDALRRAIDDDYDFRLACEGHYGQSFRRFRRWIGFPIIKKDINYQ